MLPIGLRTAASPVSNLYNTVVRKCATWRSNRLPAARRDRL